MFGDFVAQLGASTGTGQYSLGSTFGSTITWRSEFASDDVVGYLATTQDATKREVGWGIFTIGTPDKLTRNVVRSTQANGPVDWGGGEVYRVFSVPLGFVLSAMVNAGLGDELPGWAPPGFGRLDDTDAAFWVKLRHLGEGDESEEGRHYLTAGIFAASPRRLWVDHGAAAHAATKADIGKVHLFNVTSADRVLTLPASAGVGHGFAMRGYGYGSADNNIVITPNGTDAIDGGANGATLSVPGGVPLAIEWDAINGKWRTNINTGPVAADAFRTNANNVNAQTGATYTLLAKDNGKTITLSNASAITLTVPSGLPAGFSCFIVQLGAGQVTIVASGTTLRSRVGLTTGGQYAQGGIIFIATNTYSVGGDLTT
jgi:hypothetical protein